MYSEALKRDFIEGVDCQTLNKKVDQVSGAKYLDDYFLTPFFAKVCSNKYNYYLMIINPLFAIFVLSCDGA